MPMTVEQMVDLFRVQAGMSLTAVEKARKSRSYDLAAFNLSSAFDACLMTGLIQWRLGEDPRPALKGALDVVPLGLEVLEGLNPDGQHWKSCDFSRNGFLELLLDEKSSPWPHPATAQWALFGADYASQFLDRGLLEAAQSDDEPPEWQPLLSTLRAQPRLSLLSDTYSAYLETVRAADRNLALRSAEAASRLFSRREADDYFAGGRGTDGGGPDNEHVVDFRLAALVRARLPEAASALTPDTRLHLWRW